MTSNRLGSRWVVKVEPLGPLSILRCRIANAKKATVISFGVVPPRQTCL